MRERVADAVRVPAEIRVANCESVVQSLAVRVRLSDGVAIRPRVSLRVFQQLWQRQCYRVRDRDPVAVSQCRLFTEPSSNDAAVYALRLLNGIGFRVGDAV